MSSTVQTHAEFLSTRYWPQLDGLRTVSILLVIFTHMGDPIWDGINGRLGVTLFFVISGYLITSLLIREEHRDGRAAMGKFYIRRAFRILPMYYLAVAITLVAVLVLHLGSGTQDFWHRMFLIATLNGDFAGTGVFSHAWSIGIEEKFYILWPLIAFVVPMLTRHRAIIVTVLLPVVVALGYVPGWSYFGLYTGIVAGCAVAIAMHDPRGYSLVAFLANRWIFLAALAAAVFAFLWDQQFPGANISGNAHAPFAIAAALAFPGVLIGRGWASKALSWQPVVFVGTLAYGIYLFHVFAIDLVGYALPDGQTDDFLISVIRLVAATALSFIVAWVLHRFFERPLIQLGRRLTARDSKPGTVVAGSSAGPVETRSSRS